MATKFFRASKKVLKWPSLYRATKKKLRLPLVVALITYENEKGLGNGKILIIIWNKSNTFFDTFRKIWYDISRSHHVKRQVANYLLSLEKVYLKKLYFLFSFLNTSTHHVFGALKRVIIKGLCGLKTLKVVKVEEGV